MLVYTKLRKEYGKGKEIRKTGIHKNTCTLSQLGGNLEKNMLKTKFGENIKKFLNEANIVEFFLNF